MRLQRPLALVIVLSACSGGGEDLSDSGPSDLVDALVWDAAPVAPTCSGAADYYYVVDEIELPSNPSAASMLALDIDGDSVADNAFGGLLGALTSTANWDLQSPTTEQIARGELLQLFGLSASSVSDASAATLCTYTGTTPSVAPCTNQANLATCGQHLLGTTSFSVASDTPTVSPAVGPISAGSFESTNPNAPASLFVAISFARGTPLVLPIEFAKVSMATTGTSLTSGIIGGGLNVNTVNAIVLPRLASAITVQVENDCTPSQGNCGCPPNSQGRSLLDFFDTNDDCTVPLAELSSNSIIDATIRNPDLDLLNAAGDPGADGVNDHLSIGLGFSAASASF